MGVLCHSYLWYFYYLGWTRVICRYDVDSSIIPTACQMSLGPQKKTLLHQPPVRLSGLLVYYKSNWFCRFFFDVGGSFTFKKKRSSRVLTGLTKGEVKPPMVHHEKDVTLDKLGQDLTSNSWELMFSTMFLFLKPRCVPPSYLWLHAWVFMNQNPWFLILTRTTWGCWLPWGYPSLPWKHHGNHARELRRWKRHSKRQVVCWIFPAFSLRRFGLMEQKARLSIEYFVIFVKLKKVGTKNGAPKFYRIFSLLGS